MSPVFSRSDGVVAWQCSVEPKTALSESIEIGGSHCGLEDAKSRTADLGGTLGCEAFGDRAATALAAA